MLCNNISILGLIKGVYHTLKNKVMWFNLYKQTYKNYPSVVFNQTRMNFPLTAILKNNKQLKMNSIDETALFALLTNHKNMNYDKKNDMLTVSLSSEFISIHCNGAFAFSISFASILALAEISAARDA